MGTKSSLENKSSLSTLISPVSPPTSACSSSEFSGFHLPPAVTTIYPYSNFSGSNTDYRTKKLKNSTCHHHGILGAFSWFALGTFVTVLAMYTAVQWDLLQFSVNQAGASSFTDGDHEIILNNVEFGNDSIKKNTSSFLEVKCMTPACLQAAARILHRIDPDQDPCEDFYLTSCGSFIAHNEIPDDSFQRSTLQEMQESILVDIKSKL